MLNHMLSKKNVVVQTPWNFHKFPTRPIFFGARSKLEQTLRLSGHVMQGNLDVSQKIWGLSIWSWGDVKKNGWFLLGKIPLKWNHGFKMWRFTKKWGSKKRMIYFMENPIENGMITRGTKMTYRRIPYHGFKMWKGVPTTKPHQPKWLWRRRALIKPM